MRISKRRYQVKKKKSILKNKFFWTTVLTILFLGFSFWLTIFSPIFQIKMVLVSGNEKVSISEIEQLVYPKIEKKMLFFNTKSIFLVDTKSIKGEIVESYPVINDLSLRVKKLLPNSLSVEMVERKKVALWSMAETYFSVDEKGIAFEEANREPEEDLIIVSKQPKGEISLKSKVIDEKALSQILMIKETIWEKAKIEAKEFTLFESEARLNVKTTEGWEAYFYLEGDLNWQLIELELVLEKQLPQEKRQGLEYIDLRFSKVYYK